MRVRATKKISHVPEYGVVHLVQLSVQSFELFGRFIWPQTWSSLTIITQNIATELEDCFDTHLTIYHSLLVIIKTLITVPI